MPRLAARGSRLGPAETESHGVIKAGGRAARAGALSTGTAAGTARPAGCAGAPIPTPDQRRLAESELRAAVLAGELVAVGPCWASPAEPQTPSLRAAAVAWAITDRRLVACTRTAAWIWGAVSRPTAPLELCVPSQIRVHGDATFRVREMVLPDDDVARLGDLRVTIPTRTAVDLLRAPGTADGEFGTAESSAVDGLLVSGAVTRKRSSRA
ncbi:hypothetical protein P9139_14385 [Curtobacterium flaccumfaciens]|nr:hypothetical protein P9139_14385 [Curtobacterium flaccumfaciens]